MQRALDLGKLVNSNQARSYRSLAQVTRSVPQRVQFTKMTFDGVDSLIIEGVAFSDQDILNFISNLNAKSLIEQASLAAMSNQTNDQSRILRLQLPLPPEDQSSDKWLPSNEFLQSHSTFD